MSYRIQLLRDSAEGEICVRCGSNRGVCLAHYFGPRRGAYGGGLSCKGHDAVAALLCQECHLYMDTGSRDKTLRWLLSEEFLHYCALTWIRWLERGVLVPQSVSTTEEL